MENKEVKRIQVLDIIRGVALFGVFMINIYMMVNGSVAELVSGADPAISDLNLGVQYFRQFFFQGKFFPLFSLLFGYGFWLFLQKKDADPLKVVKSFKRRMWVLLCFGVLHFVFLWSGDILFYYAIFGFILLSCRNVSNRGLIIRAIWCVAIPLVIMTLSALMLSLMSLSPVAMESMDQGMMGMEESCAEILATYASGSFMEIMLARLNEWSMSLSSVFVIYLISLSMFFLGTFIARKGYLVEPQKHMAVIKRTIWITLVIGLILNVSAVITDNPYGSSTDNGWADLFLLAGGICFALLYPCLIVLLYQKCENSVVFSYLAAGGRMALTNYLGQSLIVSLIIYPYGLGYFGKISQVGCLGLCVGIFILQLVLSKWWLSKFRFGPMEYIWRRLYRGADKV